MTRKKKRNKTHFLRSIFQSTYPFTDGRIVAVPLWYPLHHWHHGLQVPSAPRWCHLHCTCLRPWRNSDGNNGNCLFFDTGDETNSQNHHSFGESFDEMAICLCENIWRGVLFVHVGKCLRRHFWCVVILLVTKNLHVFISVFFWTLRSNYWSESSPLTLYLDFNCVQGISQDTESSGSPSVATRLRVKELTGSVSKSWKFGQFSKHESQSQFFCCVSDGILQRLLCAGCHHCWIGAMRSSIH